MLTINNTDKLIEHYRDTYSISKLSTIKEYIFTVTNPNTLQRYLILQIEREITNGIVRIWVMDGEKAHVISNEKIKATECTLPNIIGIIEKHIVGSK